MKRAENQWFSTTTRRLKNAQNFNLTVPGYRFDAILVEANRPNSNLVIWEDLDTGDDALQKIIYNAGRQDIRKVWVDGRRVVDKDAD